MKFSLALLVSLLLSCSAYAQVTINLPFDDPYVYNWDGCQITSQDLFVGITTDPTNAFLTIFLTPTQGGQQLGPYDNRLIEPFFGPPLIPAGTYTALVRAEGPDGSSIQQTFELQMNWISEDLGVSCTDLPTIDILCSTTDPQYADVLDAISEDQFDFVTIDDLNAAFGTPQGEDGCQAEANIQQSIGGDGFSPCGVGQIVRRFVIVSQYQEVARCSQIINIIDDGTCGCCPDGDITLGTDTELDYFTRNYEGSNCDNIPGDLIIGPVGGSSRTEGSTNVNDPIFSLRDFEDLGPFTVGGDLIIRNNPNLTSLAGLELLSAINGEIIIINNPQLTDIAAISTINPTTITAFTLEDGANLGSCASDFTCGLLEQSVPVSLSGNGTGTGCASLTDLMSACAALPVTYEYLSAVAIDNKWVSVEWATLAESENEQFVIEHAGADQVWSEVGRVRGSANATQRVIYNFQHLTPATGINYYRLNQVDFSGVSTASSVLTVRIEAAGAAALNVFPNPVGKGHFRVSSGDGFSPADQLLVYASSGKLVLTQPATESLIDASQLSPGVYHLLLRGKHSGSTRLIVR